MAAGKRSIISATREKRIEMSASAPATAVTLIVRQGAKLIFTVPALNQAVDLPPICVRCGAPSNGKPVKKTFFWHNPALYILLVSPIIYIIVAAIVRKTMRINIPLCAQHAQRRTTAIIFAWLIPVIGVADIFVLARLGVDPVVIVLIFIASLLAGLVVWAVAGNPIRPRSIDNYYGEFSGFCEVFLEQFPQGMRQAPVLTPQVPPSQVPPPPPAIG